MSRFSIRATAREQARVLPGDDFIPNAVEAITHAATVRCPAGKLWPWLAQMGAGRAGWYSYDWIDNGRRRSAERIVPALQNPSVGSIFPALPGRWEGFVLAAQEANHWLVLGWPAERGGYDATWAFVLDEIQPGATRLVVRVRVGPDYRFQGVQGGLGLWLARLVHFFMQRKQLVGIASRAERLAS